MATKRASPLPVAKYNDWTAHAGACRSVCLGVRSGQLVASGGDDALVKLWHIRRPTELATLHGCKKAVVTVQFNPSEYHIMCGSETGMLSFFDLAHSKLTRQIAAHRTAVSASDWHPLNDALAACGGADTSVKLFDTRSGAEYACMKGHTRAVTHMRFTPDGRMIASGDAEGRVFVWDLSTGKPAHVFEPPGGHSGGVSHMDFHPEEYLLACTYSDSHVRVFTCDASASVYASAGACVVESPVRVCAFTPDGAALATLTADALRLWDVPRGDTHVRMHTLDVVDVPWTGVASVWMGTNVRPATADAAPGEHAPVHCVAAAMHARNVSVWGVDVTQLHPYAPTPLAAAYARPHVREEPHAAHAHNSNPSKLMDAHTTDRGHDDTDTKLEHAALPSPPRPVAVASPPRDAPGAHVLTSSSAAVGAAVAVPSAAATSHVDAPPQQRKKHRNGARAKVAVRTIDLHADAGTSEEEGDDARVRMSRDAYSDDFHAEEPATPSSTAVTTAAQQDAKMDDEPLRAASRVDAIAQAVAQARAVAAAVVQQAPAPRATVLAHDASRRGPTTSPLRSRSSTPPPPLASAASVPATSASIPLASAPITHAESSRPRVDSLEGDFPPASKQSNAVAVRETAPPAAAAAARPAERAQRSKQQQVAPVPEASKRAMVTPDAPSAPLIPSTRDRPLGLSFAAFMPANSARGFGMSRVGPFTHTASLNASGGLNSSSRPSSTRARDNSASERACRRMHAEHARTVDMLQARAAAVARVAASWRAGDAKVALQQAHVLEGDVCVAMDVIRHVRVESLALESAAQMLSLSQMCLPAVHTDAERVGAVFKAVKTVLATFKPVVSACVEAYVHACSTGSGVVDPAMEDRMTRCITFVKAMHALRGMLNDGTIHHADARALAMDVLQLIAAADAAMVHTCAPAASDKGIADVALQLGISLQPPAA